MRREQVSAWQLFTLLVLTRLVPSTIVYPAVFETQTTQSVWIGSVVGTMASFGYVALLTALGMRFPGKTIVQYAETLLGHYAGKAVGLVLSTIWVLLGTVVNWSVAEIYAIAPMPRTPPAVFIIPTVALSAYVARSGLEVLARVAEIAFWVVVLSMVLILLLPAGLFDFGNLLPLLPDGLMPIILSGGSTLVFALSFTSLAWILPHLSEPRLARRAALSAVMTAGLLVTAQAVVMTAVFGSAASAVTLALFNLNRISRVDFIERTEMLAIIAWTFSSVVSAALFLWVEAHGIGQVLGLKQPKHLVYPLALISVVLGGRILRDFPDFLRFIKFANFGVVGVLYMGLVPLLAGIALLRGHWTRP